MIVADGFSCRTQIEQGTGRKALHLAEVIQRALREQGERIEDRDGVRSRSHSTVRSVALVAGIGAAAAAALAWRLRRVSA